MESTGPRKREIFDFDWLFYREDEPHGHEPGLDDAGWRRVDLPHDWSISGPWLEDAPAGPAGGFAPLGFGWYRKHFSLPESAVGKRVYLDFDGIFNHSDIWINGVLVYHNEYGYLGFRCDLTPWIHTIGGNVVAVRVDNTRQASRWYTGSGIYRHTWLTITEPLHVAHWGTYVTTAAVNAGQAHIRVQTTVANDTDAPRQASVRTQLSAPDGEIAGSGEVTLVVPARSQAEAVQTVLVEKPQLWSTASPHLYCALTEIYADGNLLDRYETPFGIRTVEFSGENGLILNGERLVLKGANIHHDLGALGAASLEPAIERRLLILKEMGCNAVRLAHNPYAPETLDLCDRLGLLAYDEIYDKWYTFGPDGRGWQEDMQAWLKRDRNHPSVFIWSVGNEVVPHQHKHEGTLLYRAMAEVIHRFEPTRPVTIALHPARSEDGSWYGELPEVAGFMDVITMNYQARWYQRDHEKYPDKSLLGGEVYLTLPIDGYAHHVKDLTGERNAEEHWNEWFGVRDYLSNEYYPYVAGQFLWAGIDYLGGGLHWPRRGSAKNLVDTCGFRRPYSYYYQSLYTDEPLVRIAVHNPEFQVGENMRRAQGWLGQASHWNWPARLATLKVFTYTNAPVVELILNGRSLGEKRLCDCADRLMVWDVPNEPGTLEALAKKDGAVVALHRLQTAGEAVRLRLRPDRSWLRASGQDLAHVEVQAVDEHGCWAPGLRALVSFRISGPGRIAGVDNGDLDSPEPYQACERELRDGCCLLIVRSTRESGVIRLSAGAQGLAEAVLEISVQS